MKFSTSILILACIAWGILLGGVVYSHLVFFPAYLSDLPRSAVVVNGPYAINDPIFWMVIHPILILLMIAAIIANRENKARRKLIVISFTVYVTILVVSAFYFVPELMQFKTSAVSTAPPSEWMKRGQNWLTYSIIRGCVLLVVTFPLFKALTLPSINKNAYSA